RDLAEFDARFATDAACREYLVRRLRSLRRRWTRRSRSGRVGRPSTIEPQLHTLVREMAAANPLWGAPRIHGELRALGIDISERTAPRVLARHGGHPSCRRGGRFSPITWRPSCRWTSSRYRR